MTDTAEQHVSSYDVLVDGSEIAQAHKDRLKEIRVVDYLRLPDVCTLLITYPKGDGVDSQPFAIGSKVEVRLGAREAMAPKTLFKGEVATIEPEFGAGGCSVSIRAFDSSQKLNRSRAQRTFQNQTASDIVSGIVSDAGLHAQCDPSGDPFEFMQQDNETDWDFIWRLAERVGFEFVVDEDTAYFRAPKPDGAVELEWPDTLHTFRPRLTAVQQVKTVTLQAHDPKTKEVIKSQATTPQQIAQIGVQRSTVAGAFPDATIHVATEPVKSRAEGDALAQALLDKLANGYIAAEGVAPGNPDIKAGAKVHVTGVGEKFSGTYRVAMAQHVLRGGGGYETVFANSASHTILGAVNGSGAAAPAFGTQLVLGVVTNNQDPENMGRVRVSYPALSDDVEGAWARVVLPSAGKERGLLMLPVVGEEVLIGFEHDDTTRPYVLGSLFNGKDTPGDLLIQGQDGSFALRSDQKIYAESQDDTHLKSAKKLIVEITDDVEETFQKDWKNQTTGQITLKATQAFNVEGQSLSIKGDMDVTLEGMTGLTLKCGASQIQISPSGVTISGPTVNLG